MNTTEIQSNNSTRLREGAEKLNYITGQNNYPELRNFSPGAVATLKQRIRRRFLSGCRDIRWGACP